MTNNIFDRNVLKIFVFVFLVIRTLRSIFGNVGQLYGAELPVLAGKPLLELWAILRARQQKSNRCLAAKILERYGARKSEQASVRIRLQ